MNSFYLPTATSKFYPDFILLLKSGKIVVAEYKGEHLRSNDDTKEKEMIGELWASKSDNLAFLMLYVDDYREKLISVLGEK